jgi:hypothetical protein
MSVVEQAFEYQASSNVNMRLLSTNGREGQSVNSDRLSLSCLIDGGHDYQIMYDMT